MRFLLILVALGVIVAGIVEWAWSAWDAPGPVARAGNQTVILIPARSRTHAIAQMLEAAGTVKYGLLFEADAHLKGVSSRFKAGEYAIPGTPRWPRSRASWWKANPSSTSSPLPRA